MMEIEHTPLEIVRGIAPVVGVAAIGVAIGMLLVGMRLTCEPLITVQAACGPLRFASSWATRLTILGGVAIGGGILAEDKLED